MNIVAHNLSAMNTQRMYGITSKKRAKATEKLSSGFKINRAADDAAGLSISEKMRKQIRGLTQGVRNTQDGISLCQVADGALAEVNEMLHRITELSVKAANASLYSLITRDYYTYEERLNALVTMLQFEREVAQIAMDAFPNKKVKGYFFDYGYEYPAIKVGYSSTKYFMFANFDGPINGYDYKSTTISDYHIDETGGDQFVCSFHDDGKQLKKDAKKITGYDIEYSDRY